MRQKQLGFTLAEVLVAIVIGVISIAAAFSSYGYFSKAHKSVSQKSAINSSAREALAVITRDLRNAGYVDVNFNASDKDTKLISLTQKFLNNEFDKFSIWNTTAPTQRMQVEYYPKKYSNSKYQNTNTNRMYLARKVTMNGSATPIYDNEFVPNLADFQIVFRDKSGAELYPVCDYCGTIENAQGSGQMVGSYNLGQANMKKVHTVEIYLTLESAQEVYGENKSTVITNAAGTNNGSTLSFKDKYHRETFFVSVHTRNLAKHVAISEQTGTSIGQTSTYNK
jgi:prepilin-type N-terminal cleavage/methylation domain-containing protein